MEERFNGYFTVKTEKSKWRLRLSFFIIKKKYLLIILQKEDERMYLCKITTKNVLDSKLNYTN